MQYELTIKEENKIINRNNLLKVKEVEVCKCWPKDINTESFQLFPFFPFFLIDNLIKNAIIEFAFEILTIFAHDVVDETIFAITFLLYVLLVMIRVGVVANLQHITTHLHPTRIITH